jgi:hypothetical protein
VWVGVIQSGTTKLQQLPLILSFPLAAFNAALFTHIQHFFFSTKTEINKTFFSLSVPE